MDVFHLVDTVPSHTLLFPEGQIPFFDSSAHMCLSCTQTLYIVDLSMRPIVFIESKLHWCIEVPKLILPTNIIFTGENFQ